MLYSKYMHSTVLSVTTRKEYCNMPIRGCINLPLAPVDLCFQHNKFPQQLEMHKAAAAVQFYLINVVLTLKRQMSSGYTWPSRSNIHF